METTLYKNLMILRTALSLVMFVATPAAAEDFSRYALWSVTEKTAQVRHSKELMGSGYRGSVVKRAEKFSEVPSFIYDTVKERFADKFKHESGNLTNAILQEARRYGFDPLFIMAVIQTESGFDAHAKGRFGEIGLMQIKPDTAEWICKKYGIHWKGAASLKVPAENVKIGAAYFAYLRGTFRKQSQAYIGAYNMGPANMKRALANERTPEEYHARIMGRYLQFYAAIPKGPSKSEQLRKDLRLVAASAILKR